MYEKFISDNDYTSQTDHDHSFFDKTLVISLIDEDASYQKYRYR